LSKSKQLDRLSKITSSPVVANESYVINKKMYVTRKFVAAFFSVDVMAVVKWEKANGLKRSNKGYDKLILYDLAYVIEFREEMLGNSKSKKDRNMDNMEYDKVELQKKKNEVTLQDIKIREAKGDLVKSDVADKAIAEFGALFVGFLRNSRLTLSKDLVNMSSSDIFAFLDHHYGEFVKDVDGRVHKVDDEKLDTIYSELIK